MFLQNSNFLFRKFRQLFSRNCFEELGGLRWCRAVTALLLILLEHRASGHCPVTVEKSRSRPGVENDRTGAQLPPHSATSVAELEPAVYRLEVPTPGCDTVAAGLHPNEQHPYDVEK
jgi:hypothetical protein